MDVNGSSQFADSIILAGTWILGSLTHLIFDLGAAIAQLF